MTWRYLTSFIFSFFQLQLSSVIRDRTRQNAEYRMSHRRQEQTSPTTTSTLNYIPVRLESTVRVNYMNAFVKVAGRDLGIAFQQ